MKRIIIVLWICLLLTTAVTATEIWNATAETGSGVDNTAAGQGTSERTIRFKASAAAITDGLYENITICSLGGTSAGHTITNVHICEYDNNVGDCVAGTLSKGGGITAGIDAYGCTDLTNTSYTINGSKTYYVGYVHSGVGGYQSFDGAANNRVLVIGNYSYTEDWTETTYAAAITMETTLSGDEIVSNNAPTISSVTLIPSTPRTQTDQNCSAYYEDSDGDSGSVNFTWYINGTQDTSWDSQDTSISNGTTAYAQTLVPKASITLNSNITCSAYASDGTDNSGWVNGTETTVLSELPVISGELLRINDIGGTPDVFFRFNVTDADGSGDLDSCFAIDTFSPSWNSSNITAWSSNPITIDVENSLLGVSYVGFRCNDTTDQSDTSASIPFNLTEGTTYDAAVATSSLTTQYFNRTDSLINTGTGSSIAYNFQYIQAIQAGATTIAPATTGTYSTSSIDIYPVWQGNWITKDSQTWTQDTSQTKSLDTVNFNDTAYTFTSNSSLSNLTLDWNITADTITGMGTCTGATWDTGTGSALTVQNNSNANVTVETSADCFAKEGSHTWAQNTSATKSLAMINFQDTAYTLTNYFPTALTVDWDITADAPSLTGCTGEAWNISSGTDSVNGGSGTLDVDVSSYADCFGAVDSQTWTQDTSSTKDPSNQTFYDSTYLLNNSASISLQVDWDVSAETISGYIANCNNRTWITATGTDTVTASDLNVTINATADCIDTTDGSWAENSSYSHTIDNQQITLTRNYTNNATIAITLNDSISDPANWDSGTCDYCSNASFSSATDDSTQIAWYDTGDVVTDTQTNNTSPSGTTLTIIYDAATANITGTYNISTVVNNTGGYNLTNVNVMPHKPSGWNYVNSTVYQNLTATGGTATDVIDMWAIAPFINSGSEVKEILSGWERYTFTYTINMTIDEYENYTINFTIPTSNFAGWLGTSDADQLEEVRIDNVATGLSYTEASSNLTISVPNTFSGSTSLDYSTFQGKVIYLINKAGASAGSAPPFVPVADTGGGGGGGGGGTTAIAIADVLQMYPAYISSGAFTSVMPNDLLHLPTIVVQNIDDQDHIYEWGFKCPEFDISGDPVESQNCAKDWCLPLTQDDNGQWIEEQSTFGLIPNADKNIVIKCLVDSNATLQQQYVTSFCVNAEGSNSSACTLIEIPVGQTPALSAATGFLTSSFDVGANMLDYGLICFNGNDGNCLLSFDIDLTLGNFRITKLPTLSHILTVGGAAVAVGATGGLALAGGIAGGIGLIFNLLQAVMP